MDNHGKKMAAPIIITAIMLIYYIAFFAVCVWAPMPLIVKILLGVIPLLLGGVCIYVLRERIKEIRSGEEDDLSQY